MTMRFCGAKRSFQGSAGLRRPERFGSGSEAGYPGSLEKGLDMGNSNSNGCTLAKPGGGCLEDDFSLSATERQLMDAVFVIKYAPGVL
ncbi:hypothetical protein [Planobispora longispora]|uniref:Uncharacterized protein n=1 Tax=Planobispora longispora TaxID=28887 RepID=A0A8J3RH73_9ACTN|nr:hypothetical protein [Planobispora longispora]BFE87090.1 hypothetical protein GCM10020093_096910 [Planobispora longispora]GIH74730.1 hypothetical protein Plo01_11590 [Planobispora longispora]